MKKIESEYGGINRLAGILLLLIAIMLVLIAIPSWQRFEVRSEEIACEQAIKSASDGLIIEYLTRFEEESVEEARRSLDEIMPERPNICPAGGTVYLVLGDDGIYVPVCGLHDPDYRLRTRLNASRARDLLKTSLEAIRLEGGPRPASVQISLNGKHLECVRVTQEEPIYRGTSTTKGYKGVVAFYGLAGEGKFSVGHYAKGEIVYFLYADENSIAVWRQGNGWTGDAYEGV